MNPTIWLVILPLMAAFLLEFLNSTGFKIIDEFLLGFSAAWLLLLGYLVVSLDELPRLYSTGGWSASFAINLLLDELSLIFILINGLFFLLILAYSSRYIEDSEETGDIFFVFLFISITSVNGLILTSDLFNLFVFFEIMAISSYALVATSGSEFSTEAAFKYMVIGFISSLFLLAGIVMTYLLTGTLNMAGAAAQLQELPSHFSSFIFLFYFIPFAMKFTYIPFHFWLADIYQGSNISYNVMSSALIINANLFAFIRLSYSVFGLEILSFPIRPVLLTMAVLTVLLGHTLAYRQRNLKRLLAYSGVAQVGYIMLGTFLFTAEGLSGGLFHMVNNGLLKMGVFFIASIFFKATRSQNILYLKGISFKFPVLGAIFTIFCLGLVGLPPFNAFASKIVIIKALVSEGLWPLALTLPVGSFMALTYYLKIIKIIYSPGHRAEKSYPDWSLNFYLPMIAATAAMVALLGLYPGSLYPHLLSAAEYISEQGPLLLHNIIEVTG